MPTLCRPAVAVPENVITQEETLSLCKDLHADHPQLKLALRLLRNTGVQKRHLIQPIEETLKDHGMRRFEIRNQIYVEQAKRMTAPVIREALDHAKLTAAEIDAVIAVSSTGFMMPSSSARFATNRKMLAWEIFYRTDCSVMQWAPPLFEGKAASDLAWNETRRI